MEKAFLERCLARGMTLREIAAKADRAPSTVSYHLKRHGLTANNAGPQANRGAIPRPVLAGMASQGRSIRAMAERLDRSAATVRYWLGKYGLTTVGMDARRPEIALARREGRRSVTAPCRHHGATEFVLESRGYYRCLKCRRAGVSAWRRRAKRRLVASAGGRCALCGYDRYPGALQFHHLDPSAKRFAISRQGVTRAMSELQAEAEKCVLLCANCHAEVEGGAAQLDDSGSTPPAGLEPARLH